MNRPLRPIRRVYEESGEFAAVAELRRYFPGITDNTNARRASLIY
jgi:hypothetical protein